MNRFLLTACLIFASTLMSEAANTLAFAASTRADSYNKKLMLEAAQMARDLGAKVTVIDLKDYPMPFYDEDLEKSQGLPASVQKFQELVVASDTLIIASSEYNGSFPGLLKNALDWASRGQRDLLKGKKVALMSASPGQGGGARGLKQLEIVITNLGGSVVQPEVSVGSAQNAFTADGHIADDSLKQELRTEIQHLVGTQNLAFKPEGP